MKAKKRKMFNTRFWGVRGSIPCPFKNYLKYGGNTSCVSVNCDDQLIIFDSGTGIRSLGNQIIKNKQKKINLMMSHTHWDHINGFPFFQPAYSKDFFLDIYCGNLKKYGNSIYNVLSSQMKHPTFPVSIDIFEAKIYHVPGHTIGHICFHFFKNKLIFTGDTLFSLGCGRIFEGSYEQMYNSLQVLKNLDKDTKIYCGHEYTLKNSEFCLAQDSNNNELLNKIKEIKEKIKQGKTSMPSTIGEELNCNIFLKSNDLENFKKLRDLKDNF